MKKIIVFLFFVSGFLFAQENNTFSDRGYILLNGDDYFFNIILVNDLEQAINIWDTADTIPQLSSSTKVKMNNGISPFIMFGSLKNGNINLTYDFKLKRPNGSFSPNEYYNLVIARRNISGNIFLRGEELLTVIFDETDAFGKYQFHITIKDNGKIICNCIMEIELIE